MIYAADFETITDENDCRVWAWGIAAIDDSENTFICGNSLMAFMETMKKLDKPKVYFHNLKFDGSFILDWLFKAGFKYMDDSEKLPEQTFSCLISDMGQFYSIKVCLDRGSHRVKLVTFCDSMKLFPNMNVKRLARDFDTGLEKLDIDYDDYRPQGHELTDLEKAYLKNDVLILAKALDKTINGMNLNRLTIGSCALSSFKGMLSMKFDRLFPPPLDDADLRLAYKGGFTYVSKLARKKEIGPGIVLDVNSLYPYVMSNRVLPYGKPVFFTGQYRPDKLYPLFIQQIRCQFDIKPDRIPTIQIKKSIHYSETEYLENSDGIETVLTLTSVDLALFLEQYDVFNLEYLSGWKFKGSSKIFETYVNHWTRAKIKAKQENNKSLYTISKLMQNSLYGKFATNPVSRRKIPYYDDHLKFKTSSPESRDPVYVPAAAFITAYARNITIRAAQALYPRFLYADTDSLHLAGLELPDSLEIDDVKLGAWKHEATFQKAKFIRQKCYVEIIDDKLKITCAGMPESCHKFVTWDNFRMGMKFDGKLVPKKVPGGTVLVQTEFTIRE